MSPPLTDTSATGSGAEGKTDRELIIDLMGKFTDAFSRFGSPQDEVTVRASKLEKLYGFFIKHAGLRQYKPYDSIDVRHWLSQFDAAVDTIANAGCGLDLTADPLTSVEFAKLLRTKISYEVDAEITQFLGSIDKDWSTATIAEMRSAMKQLYMRREPKVCSILKLFSGDRIKKGNLSVSAYYAKWKANLAPCVDVKTDAEKVICHDLMLLASFYGGIDDPNILREISKIPEEEQNLKSMLDGALAAESREIHFKDTLNRSHAIDGAIELKSTPAVARTDAQWPSNNKKSNKGRGKNRASFDT